MAESILNLLDLLPDDCGVSRRLRQVVCVLTSDGIATLQGQLPSWHLKQLAQTLAQKASCVRVVVNRIEVVEPRVPHDSFDRE